MPTFVITTEESVTGKYRIEAKTQEEAESRIKGAPPINWDHIEQIDYSAFSVEIRDVVEE